MVDAVKLIYSCHRENGVVTVWNVGNPGENHGDTHLIADLSDAEMGFDEKVAWARLLCAAPEMAEALRAAKEALNKLSGYVPYGSTDYELGGDAYSRIDDALSRARGEEADSPPPPNREDYETPRGGFTGRSTLPRWLIGLEDE